MIINTKDTPNQLDITENLKIWNIIQIQATPTNPFTQLLT